MTAREKLIALMVEAARERDREYSDFQAKKLLIETPILLANGVTIQRWIPVEERLPQEQGFYRVYHKNSKAISDRFYYKDCPDLFVNVTGDPITHWKPIEQPPKEVE